jgi:hypothetical protein
MLPFTTRRIDRESGAAQPLVLKLDPGTAAGREDEVTAKVVSQTELNIAERRLARRSNGAPGFDNRRRPYRWIAPSLQHRVDTVTQRRIGFAASLQLSRLFESCRRALDSKRLFNSNSFSAIKHVFDRCPSRCVCLTRGLQHIPAATCGWRFRLRLTALRTTIRKARLARLQLELFFTYDANFDRKWHRISPT